jgi:hypothetical protein
MINKLFNKISKDSYIFIYLFWIFIFVVSNTKHLDYEQSLILGAADGYNYLKITEYFPRFSEEIIPYHQAQRFLLSFIVGLLSEILNSKNFFLFFRLTTYIVTIIFFILIYRFYKKNKKKIRIENFIILTSVILLNPYLIKYYISLPTLLNDLIFIIMLFIFCENFYKNKVSIAISVLSLFFRQTGLILIISIVLKNFLDKKLIVKKKIFNILIIITLAAIVININNFYASNVSNKPFDYGHIFGIYNWIINDFNLIIFIKFISYPLLSLSPIILIFFLIENKKDILNIKKIYYVLLIFLICLQPYLGGPILTSNNIVRLVTLIYPICFFLLIDLSFKKILLKRIIMIFLLIFLHLWNLHPTYSRLSFFNYIS